MAYREAAVIALLGGMLIAEGCKAGPERPSLLSAPAGADRSAVGHHLSGMQAYERREWDDAKQHFEAALVGAPDLAESHYNLAKTLYKLGHVREGDTHFIHAANLAPGNKVIWNSPPLAGVSVPDKTVPMPSGDGHSHGH